MSLEFYFTFHYTYQVFPKFGQIINDVLNRFL